MNSNANTLSSTSQRRQIAEMLERGASITDAIARRLFSCSRLAARIHELRASGMDISSQTVTHNKKRFASYSLNK